MSVEKKRGPSPSRALEKSQVGQSTFISSIILQRHSMNKLLKPETIMAMLKHPETLDVDELGNSVKSVLTVQAILGVGSFLFGYWQVFQSPGKISFACVFCRMCVRVACTCSKCVYIRV